MNKFLASLLYLTSLAVSAAGLQTINVDVEHIQMGLSDGQVGEHYTIKPAIEIELDTSKYQFPEIPGSEINEPYAIQLIIDNEHQFTAYWESGVTKYTLKKSKHLKFSGLVWAMYSHNKPPSKICSVCRTLCA